MSQPPTTRPPAARRPRGFTTIELMVAIAIIVVLLGIVIVGFKRVSTGASENQTKTILERMRSMTAVITSNKIAAQKLFQSQVPTVYTGYVGAVAGSTASMVTDETTGSMRPAWWEAVIADADDGLYRTALVVKAIGAAPEAKAIFDELPANRRKLFHFNRTTGLRVDAANPPTTESLVLPLDAWGNPILFVFDNWQQATGVAGGVAARTIKVTATPTDTYRETGGLTNLYSVAAKGYWELLGPPVLPAPPSGGSQQPAVKALPYVYNRPTSYTAIRDAANQIVEARRSPDRQPFWASAGPDGLMQTNDDNVYSFEN